ncbi:MAG: hypothetical protein E5W90_36120, partial [Mesorhizobium sp.]
MSRKGITRPRRCELSCFSRSALRATPLCPAGHLPTEGGASRTCQRIMAFGPHLLLAALEGLVTSAVLALTALG